MENIPQNESRTVPAKKRSSFIKWALVLGIAIVINLFLTYAVRVIHHEPVYTDFCPERQVNEAIESKEACLKMGGQWNENMDLKVTPQPEMGRQLAGYCNQDFTCGNEFNTAFSQYNRNVFVVFIIAGILLLAGSVFLTGAETVSLALSFGGVLALIIGSMRYWSDMNEIVRVIILGVALAVLIWVAWKKFRD